MNPTKENGILRVIYATCKDLCVDSIPNKYNQTCNYLATQYHHHDFFKNTGKFAERTAAAIVEGTAARFHRIKIKRKGKCMMNLF